MGGGALAPIRVCGAEDGRGASAPSTAKGE